MTKFHGNLKHFVGERFGNLTLINHYPGIRNHKWLMKCDCGNEFEAWSSNVITGKTSRCIKCLGIFLSEMKRQKLEGKRYGLLTVIKRLNKKWLCKCDCGNACYRSTSGLNFIKKNGCKSRCDDCQFKIRRKKSKGLDRFAAQRERRAHIHDSRVGKKFRWFKILSYEYVEINKRYRTFYLAKCKCGTFFKIRSEQLDAYWSCGCYQKIVTSEAALKRRYLSDNDIQNCVHLFRECGYTRKELAKFYGVSYANLCHRLRFVLNKYENPEKVKLS